MDRWIMDGWIMEEQINGDILHIDKRMDQWNY